MNWRTALYVALTLAAVFIATLIGEYREVAKAAALSGPTGLKNVFTPREGLTGATRIARLWDEQCYLQCVRFAFVGDLDTDIGMTPDGRPTAPNGWMYRFLAAERGRFLDLTLTPDGQCRAESTSARDYLDSKPLPANFLDSTTAFEIAENSHGREFRQTAKLFRFYAQVTTWPSNVGGPEDPVPHRPIWQIGYLATRDKERVDLYMMIDATDGRLLTVQRFVGQHARRQIVHNAFAGTGN
jgi:hypothetical protein